MASIMTAIQIQDQLTAPIQRMTNSINFIIVGFEQMENASQNAIDTASIVDARNELREVERDFQAIVEQIRNAQEAEERLNESMKKSSGFSKLIKSSFEKAKGFLEKAGVDFSMEGIFDNANEKQQAVNGFQASTGTSNSKMPEVEKSISNLYRDNMGEGYEDIANSMVTVSQMTGKMGADLEKTTRNALLMKDVFGCDIADGLNTADVLQQKFGMNSEQAYNLIAQGAQTGLDKNVDLFDAISKYSQEFQALGMGADEMFNTLLNGSQNSEFGMDKLIESLRTFNIQARNGSKSAAEGFKILGLNANDIKAKFASGGEKAQLAFGQVTEALNNMDDPIKQNAAAMQLFGMNMDELSASGILSMNDLNGAINSSKNALAEINNQKYDDAASALASLGNTINDQLASSVGGAVNYCKDMITDFTTGLQGDLEGIQGIFGYIGFGILQVGNAIQTAAGFIVDNWSIISPIIMGVVTAIGLYNGILLANNAVQFVSNTLKGIAALKASILATSQAYAAGATFKEMFAVQGLNTALLACPLTWIILGIIALIAIIFVVVAAINKWKGTTISALGIICGAIATAGAFIWNKCIGIINSVIQAFWSFFVEPFLGIVEWILNVINGGFDSFGDAVANLIGNIISWFLSLGKIVTKIIDAIFGTDWTAGLSSLQDTVISWGKNDTAITLDRNAPTVGSRIEYGDAFKAGNKFGKGIDNNIKGLFHKEEKTKDDPFDAYKNNSSDHKYEYPTDTSNDKKQDQINNVSSNNTIPNASKVPRDVNEIKRNTKKNVNAVESVNEDFEYLRNLAEQEVINRFTTAEVKVEMGGVINQVNGTNDEVDIDKMMTSLTLKLNEMVHSVAEGVHNV